MNKIAKFILVGLCAVGLTAATLPSPTFDHIIVNGTGSTGDVSGMSVSGTSLATVAAKANAAVPKTGGTMTGGLTLPSMVLNGTSITGVGTTAGTLVAGDDSRIVGAAPLSSPVFTTGINITPSSAGGAGTINKINLYGSTYGFGISAGQLDYVVPTSSSHNFYNGSTKVGKFTSTGLDATAIGATTPSTGAFTSVTASGGVQGKGIVVTGNGSDDIVSHRMEISGATHDIGWRFDGSSLYLLRLAKGLTGGWDTARPFIWDVEGGGLSINQSGGNTTFGGSINANGGYFGLNGANPVVAINKGASGQTNQIEGFTNGVVRWAIQEGNGVTESGSNAGSDFSIDRYTDAGAFIDSPISITRSSGVVSMSARPTWAGFTPWDSGNLTPANYAPLASPVFTTGIAVTPSSAGAAGTINKINLYGGSYGFGISDHQLDYVTSSADTHNFYVGSTKVGQFTPSGLVTSGINGTALFMNGYNSGQELGSLVATNTPYIDFHSSGNNIDYDTRILASGGNTTSGNGTLNFYGYAAFAYLLSANAGINISGPFTQSNNTTTVPTAGMGIAVSHNRSGAAAETNIYNTSTNAATSFTFDQITGAGAYTTLLTLSTTTAKSTKPVQLPISTVAGLPACSATYTGGFAVVSDATAPTYRGALVGGGAIQTLVECDGTSWTSH